MLIGVGDGEGDLLQVGARSDDVPSNEVRAAFNDEVGGKYVDTSAGEGVVREGG
ncbi:hypothetical protein N9891_01300 [bacterium]|nr:hypothetical protein [bacterium]